MYIFIVVYNTTPRFENERGRAGHGWLLGSGWSHGRWKRGELRSPSPGRSQARPHRTAGILGLHPSEVSISADPAQKQKRLAAVLANGCLATLPIIGLFFQDGSTGRAGDDWALYTASPFRAFENELGVQDPVGFWGPVVSRPMETR